MRTTTVMLFIIIVLIGLNMVTAISLIHEREKKAIPEAIFTIIDGKLRRISP